MARNLFKGIVTSPQVEPGEIAAAVLGDGGNAFDAAVAASFAQGVVDPHRSGVGGFGVATIHEGASGRTRVIAFHGRAGSKVRADMWADRFEAVSPDGFGYLLAGKVNDVGPASVTVPGMVRGMALLHAGRGRLPWERLLAPAIALAEEGWVVTRQMHEYWRRPGLAGRPSAYDRIAGTPEGRRHAVKPGGEPYAEGERMRLPGLAGLYRRLAIAGPDDFYEGEVARVLLSEIGEGALFTAKDLEGYRAEEEAPLRIPFRGMDLLAPGPPAGGLPLLQTLLLCERAGVPSHPALSLPFCEILAGILSRVHDGRARAVGDPRFFPVDAARLLSDAHLASMLAAPIPTRLPGEEPAGTIQLTVADAEGNAVSLNHSLGYGSGVFSDRYGFAYNNCMSCFDPRPGRPDSIAPGRARFTATAPLIGVRDGQAVLATGAPGAARITAAMAETLLYLSVYGMRAQEAVDHERFDAVARDFLCGSAFPPGVVAGMRERGWTIRQSPRRTGYIARVFPLWVCDGAWEGGADPAEAGKAFTA